MAHMTSRCLDACARGITLHRMRRELMPARSTHQPGDGNPSFSTRGATCTTSSEVWSLIDAVQVALEQHDATGPDRGQDRADGDACP